MQYLANKSHGRNDGMFLDKMIESGTMSDRLSAAQLKVQQHAFHSLRIVEYLVAFFERKNMRDSINVLSELICWSFNSAAVFRSTKRDLHQGSAPTGPETGFL